MVNRAPSPAPARLDLVADCSGASAVVVGLSMTALLGFAGMAVDASVWYTDKISAQGAADAAAYSAGKDIWTGDSATGAVSNAKAVAAKNGFTDGIGGVTVTVNVPPTSGPNTSNSNAVEVIVNKSESLMFAGFYQSSASVGARAVALSGSTGGGYCVMTIRTGSSTTVSTADLSVNGGAVIDTTNCGVYVDSSGSDALYLTGGAQLKAGNLSIVGNYSTSGGASVTVTGAKTTGAPVMSDPYANVSTPTPGTCATTNAWTKDTTVSPGTYCNGFKVSGGAAITMSPGVYIIDRGTFDIGSSGGGGGSITGTGVTIVLTSSTGSDYATASINGGTNVTLTAPTTGSTAGLVFLQDRRDSSGSSSTINGGAAMSITGAIYFPSQILKYTGGSNTSSKCTQLIAYTINYSGGARFNNDCAGVGTIAIGQTSTMLVE
jgi:Flp pilus assembly protein TadG